MPGAPGRGPRFERIGNPAVVEFIGRNYARDAGDRYYFQNGPQRVFVSLDYTPYVFRLDDSGTGFLGHTGTASGRLKRAFFDEEGSLILAAELGVGVVLDRDLAGTIERFSDRAGLPFDTESAFHRVLSGERLAARLMGTEVAVSSVRSAEAPSRFGFVAHPVPAPGEPDC